MFTTPIQAFRLAGSLPLFFFLAASGSALAPRAGRPSATDTGRQAQWSASVLRALRISPRWSGASALAQRQPRLIVANHVSALDLLVIGEVCTAVFVVRAELARRTVVGERVAAAGGIVLDPDPRDRERVLAQVTECLRQGRSVCVFPEEDSSAPTGGLPLLAADRGPRPFAADFFQAAIDARVPVQPLALAYSARGPRWRRLLTAGGYEVRVQVLPAIDTAGMDRGALADTSARLVAASLQDLEHRAADHAPPG